MADDVAVAYMEEPGLVGHHVPVSYTHLDVYKRQHLIVFAADNGDEVSCKICLFLKGFLFLFPEGQTAFCLHLVASGYELRLS